ncbi:MAG TPA: hypothetical protein VE244_15150 [Nitrososphaeraceae archaeon]|nr:hypothetical protein [Nitrososphaeraceae archaeon]
MIEFLLAITSSLLFADINSASEEQNQSENLLQWAGVDGHYGEGVKYQWCIKHNVSQ